MTSADTCYDAGEGGYERSDYGASEPASQGSISGAESSPNRCVRCDERVSLSADPTEHHPQLGLRLRISHPHRPSDVHEAANRRCGSRRLLVLLREPHRVARPGCSSPRAQAGNEKNSPGNRVSTTEARFATSATRERNGNGRNRRFCDGTRQSDQRITSWPISDESAATSTLEAHRTRRARIAYTTLPVHALESGTTNDGGRTTSPNRDRSICCVWQACHRWIARSNCRGIRTLQRRRAAR